jgi:hypothetical protein
MQATLGLSDQALLAKLAVEDADPTVRVAAVRKATDQTLLAKIAVRDAKPEVRAAAAWKLEDQGLLARIAVDDGDPTVRAVAVKRVDDDALVAKVAQSDAAPLVREAAIGRQVDLVILSGARLLNDDASWTDSRHGREIYDRLRSMDQEIVIKAIVRMVARRRSGPHGGNVSRIHILFLAVKLGISGSEDRLNNLLLTAGDKSMAEDYLNSGSSVLYDGGARWANARGYSINTGAGSNRVGWGKF